MDKKWKTVIIVTVVVLFVVCTRGIGPENYCLDINAARAKESFYESYDYLFSWEMPDGKAVIDFVIDDNRLYTATLDIRKSLLHRGKPKCFVRAYSTMYVSEYVYGFENNPQYDWESSIRLDTADHKWCIVTKEYNDTHDKVPCFVFERDGVEYSLCYAVPA